MSTTWVFRKSLLTAYFLSMVTQNPDLNLNPPGVLLLLDIENGIGRVSHIFSSLSCSEIVLNVLSTKARASDTKLGIPNAAIMGERAAVERRWNILDQALSFRCPKAET